MGGLIMATALTLLALPAMYAAWFRSAARRKMSAPLASGPKARYNPGFFRWPHRRFEPSPRMGGARRGGCKRPRKDPRIERYCADRPVFDG